MGSEAASTVGDALVIGYGSTLRSDDSVGPMAAEAVARWGRPGVTAIATHLLSPDLAEPLATARLAVFVDARVDQLDKGVLVQPLEPGEGNKAMYHQADPAQLLTLARIIFGGYPPAWMVTIPAIDTSIGESLSSTARSALDDALIEIARLLDI
jgi:hydrogenase maturation protease